MIPHKINGPVLLSTVFCTPGPMWVILSRVKESCSLHIKRNSAALIKITNYWSHANKNVFWGGALSSFWRGWTSFQGMSCGFAPKGQRCWKDAPSNVSTSGTLGTEELFGISRDHDSCEPRDARGPALVPSQPGDVLGASHGSGCRRTICLHPLASLTLHKFNHEKREKKENTKTRHFCAFNSPAIGNSLMCIYH